jgi:predicted small lipoprotein YifL
VSRAALIALPLLAATLALAGCGKKPGFVDPPQGRAADRFPQVHPNPALDPEPAPKNRTP